MTTEIRPRARRYEVRRIGLGAVVRAAMLFGALLWICPALMLGGAAVSALRGLSGAVAGLQELTVELPVLSLPLDFTYDIPDINVDVVDQIGYADQASRVEELAGQEGLVFGGVALLALLLGAALFALPAMVFAALYNALAPITGGLELELREKA
jgi:hypothetical protein